MCRLLQSLEICNPNVPLLHALNAPIALTARYDLNVSLLDVPNAPTAPIALNALNALTCSPELNCPQRPNVFPGSVVR